MTRPTAFALALLAALLGPRLVAAQAFTGLGDLPGGNFYSIATDVSADGAVVVGSSISANGNEAFRWTRSGGIRGLGDLPGGSFSSAATGVSADGAVVVGWSFSANGNEAFRWTAFAGGSMQGLGDLPGGVFSSHASGVSANGQVAVGWSHGANGLEAFRWNGGMQGLGDLAGGDTLSMAHAVSANGAVVVGASRSQKGTEAFRWSGGTMQGLGDLPGGNFHSEAFGVSADGTVIVGASGPVGESGTVAFRWTEGGGMQGLGDLPGGEVYSVARAASEDGAIVVGESWGDGAEGPEGVPSEAFIWTAAGGMRPLKAFLEDDVGLDLTGWTLWSARGISPSGAVIVGWGTNPQGQFEGWRASTFGLKGPPADTLLVAGEAYAIRWVRPPEYDVDVYLLPDTLGAPAVLLGSAVEADSLAWTPPLTLFSRSARLVIQQHGDPASADTSAFFRVKPYHLTRLSDDGSEYVPFRPDRHGWSFRNTGAELFPEEWWSLPEFNYFFGPDPFTQQPYPAGFTDPPINARPHVHSDWPAYVRAYGTGAAYHVLPPLAEPTYRDAFTASWGAWHGGQGFGGACSGMAVSSLLAFGHREAFGARYPAVGPVTQVFPVPMSPPVREMVNTLYSYWGGTTQRAHRQAIGSTTRTPRQTLADLKAMLARESRAADGYLYIASGAAGGGAHAVVPYGLRRDAGETGRWRVLVYDPNRPADSTLAVLVDSTANLWSYGGGLNWSGSTKMYVMDPVPNYLTETGFPGLLALDAPPAAGPAPLYVAAAPGADVTLASAAGAVGYAGGAVFNTLPGAEPDVPPVGGPTPPVGYEVPVGAYTLSLSAFPEAAAAAYFFGPGVTYAYGRTDAEAAHTDRLAYDPDGGLGRALAARSDDAGVTKRVTLRALVAEEARERVLDAADLPLVGADSVAFAAVDHADGPRLRLANMGTEKAYTLRLRQASAEGRSDFVHYEVPLVAGATHLVRPVWATLGGPVEVDVDLDGDGEPEETLVLGNQVSSEPGPPAGLPTAYALHAPYPNPVRRRATLRYDMAEAGPVRLAVYDLLGREVAVLVDEDRAAGRYEASLDRQGLAAGTYLVRMTAAGGFVQTRTVTLLR